ncbi:MAG: S41 family peptidase [Oligoflexales bacterium]
MRIAFLISLTVFFLSCSSENINRQYGEGSSTTQCDEKCLERKSELSTQLYFAEEIYSYFDEKKTETGTNYSQLNRTLSSEITSSTTDTEYYRILGRWAAAFKDGHVSVNWRGNRIRVYNLPVRFELLGAGTTAEVMVVNGSDDSRVTIGDEVISIDGMPAAEAITNALGRVTGSTERMRRFSAARKLAEVQQVPEDGTIMLRLRKGTGVEQDVELPLNGVILPEKPDKEPARSADNYVKVKILSANIGYLKIDTFSADDLDRALKEGFDYIAGTKGLIIDVRSNGGGAPNSASLVMSRLTSQKIVKYKNKLRISSAVLTERTEYGLKYHLDNLPLEQKFSDYIDEEVKPAGTRYANPVVVLTSPRCFSACDTFVSGMKLNNLATIVGEATGGGTGTPLSIDLDSGNSIRYSVLNGRTILDTPIEGHGTDPDIYIAPTATSRQQGLDIQLEEAGRVLAVQIARKTGKAPLRQDYAREGVIPGEEYWRQDVGTLPSEEELFEWSTEYLEE